MTTSAPIFAVGNLDRAQAALRADGQWFIRSRGLHGFWGAWSTTPKRPDAAWYNPRLGRARLPQPEQKETTMKELDHLADEVLRIRAERESGTTLPGSYDRLKMTERRLVDAVLAGRAKPAPLIGERRTQPRPKPPLEFTDDAPATASGSAQPVAQVDAGEDGLFVEILYGDNGSPLKIGDKLYLSASAQASQAAASEVRTKADRWDFMMKVADNEGGPEEKAMDAFNGMFDAGRPKSVQLSEMVDAARAAMRTNPATPASKGT